MHVFFARCPSRLVVHKYWGFLPLVCVGSVLTMLSQVVRAQASLVRDAWYQRGWTHKNGLLHQPDDRDHVQSQQRNTNELKQKDLRFPSRRRQLGCDQRLARLSWELSTVAGITWVLRHMTRYTTVVTQFPGVANGHFEYLLVGSGTSCCQKHRCGLSWSAQQTRRFRASPQPYVNSSL
jgi:hypothetical protein